MAEVKPIEDLDAKTQKLVRRALKVRKRAYAPYSKYLVGAIVVDSKGKIHSGCNVENSNYGGSICAERNAVTKMVSRGGRQIRRVIIVASSDEPAFPCGFCRQVIAEFGPNAEIVAVNRRATQFSDSSMTDLLPFQFSKKQLRS